MMFNKKYIHGITGNNNRQYLLLFTMVMIFLSSCQTEESNNFSNTNELLFSASVRTNSNVSSRTPIEDSTVYVTQGNFGNEDFYIRMIAENKENHEVIDHGTYVVASNYEGRLAAKGTSTPLNWQSLRGNHIFYGWTFPSGGKDGFNTNNPYADFNNDNGKNLDPQEIFFRNSGEGNDYQKYQNNALYETFIGVKEGPVNYVANGTYVPLIFRHLVSKIYIQEIILNLHGAIEKHLVTNLTFYGMPLSATFYPMGKDGSSAPVVVPAEAKLSDELTFYIANKEGHDDYLYIPPEIDFSKLSFSVSILSTEEGYDQLKDYSGNFHNVVFERDGTNWDNVDDSGNWTGDDSTILHAGEMMILRIILYPGGGGGAFVTIIPWSTEDPENSAHHAKAGIYYDTSLAEIVGANDETIKDYAALYGSGDDNSTFDLYVNSSTSKDLTVPAGYNLQGKGHLITCSKNPIKVQNVYDAYLTDGKGNYVYIDAEGNIYKVNAGTFEIITPAIGKLEKNKTVSINITAGTVNN